MNAQRIVVAGLMIVMALASGACSKSDPSPTGTTANGSMSAKVDGSAWGATTIQATWSNGVLGLGGSQISGSENKQITIAGLVSQTGTYQIGLISGITGTYVEGSVGGVKTFSAQSGTLQVDQLSASGAKGSFSIEVQEQTSGGPGTAKRSVTEGKFDVKF
ncbi:MAG: hypothetical protein JST22_10375 [Bacteroidetes bacterium]|nr:hypothetical protein [Bacteroidota bacterium]